MSLHGLKKTTLDSRLFSSKQKTQKTKEMLVARRSRRFLPPPLLDGMQRVSSLLVLGVTLEDNLRVTEHVDRTLEACSRSLYALWELRSHGLPSRALHQVARATTVAKLTYASPAWWNHTSAAERDRFERFLYRMKRMDYLSDDLASAAQLVESAEDGLMRSIIAREIHVLRPLCPPVNIRKYDLRPSPHHFLLPLRDDTNYIPRTLFRWLRPNL